jgi:hypothetical protein
MAEVTTAISEFWTLFQRHATDLALAESADSPAYDRLLEQLHQIDAGLYLEFSMEPGASELVVTAEGNRSLFPLVRAIVAAAPKVDGWIIRALKPKLGFPATVRWNDLELSIDEIVFEPLEAEGSDELGLRILVPGIEAKDLESAHSAVLRAMDYGVGEERLAESVEYTEVLPLPVDEETNALPLLELDSFILWRESRNGVSAG